MIIMIILLSVGTYSYMSFAEVTKFNQDVADIENDVLIIQRAAMLFKRNPSDNWLYGIGIDFQGVINGDGTYTFFKWCSEFEDFGNIKTKSEYPNYDPNFDLSGTNGNIPISYGEVCTGDVSTLVPLSGYNIGSFNLGKDVSITGGRFLLFEAVSGKAFVYDIDGLLVESDDIRIVFDKNIGDQQTMVIKNLTGRTELLNTQFSQGRQ